MVARGSVSTVLMRPLAFALAGSEASLAQLFSASDVTPQILADDEARISPAQFCVAWAEAIRLSDDEALALRIAEAIPNGAFGVVEYVCRSAPTLRVALEQWCRYLGILDDAVDVGLVDLDGQSALRVTRESEAPAPASHELCFALVVRHARAMLAGPCPVASVSFTHVASAAHAARCAAFFDAPVTFRAVHTEVVFARDVLDTPLTTADPNLLALLLGVAAAKRDVPTPELLLTDQVRRALRASLTNDASQLEAIASGLGMTGRSLQRRLKDEGTSFQIVRDEIRRELAERFLGKGMSFSEISFLLGFSEPSAFFRAFKRWTGLTPLERRADLASARP